MQSKIKDGEKVQSGAKVAVNILGFILGTVALILIVKWLMGV